MTNMENKEPVFDELEATKYIIRQIGCSEKECEKYFEGEWEYLEQNGLLMTREEHLKQEKRIKEGKELPPEPKELDLDLMAEFIAGQSGLPMELVNAIMNAEIDYGDTIGINEYTEEKKGEEAE